MSMTAFGAVLGLSSQALFFEVMAEKDDQPCSTFLLRQCRQTMFSVAADPDMPSAEVVASALLQLKNNPRLFKKWRKQPGSTFKANGKMFWDRALFEAPRTARIEQTVQYCP